MSPKPSTVPTIWCYSLLLSRATALLSHVMLKEWPQLSCHMWCWKSDHSSLVTCDAERVTTALLSHVMLKEWPQLSCHMWCWKSDHSSLVTCDAERVTTALLSHVMLKEWPQLSCHMWCWKSDHSFAQLMFEYRLKWCTYGAVPLHGNRKKKVSEKVGLKEGSLSTGSDVYVFMSVSNRHCLF